MPNESNHEPRWDWPGGAVVAVSISFDVDAETIWLRKSQNEHRLSRLSEARYGAYRGMDRILGLLKTYDVHGTFFVPGNTARIHPHLVPAMLEAGHEIGHHGHMHLYPSEASSDEQRSEIERGLAALQAAGAVKPSGYRSPAWEITALTLELLVEYGFQYDSSCMADDRPYFEKSGKHSILELPVHWSLEDWPRFAFTVDRGGNVGSEEELFTAFLAEYKCARAEGRHITFTMHPDVIGRPYRLLQLEKLLQAMKADGNVWIAPLRDVAAHVRTRLQVPVA